MSIFRLYLALFAGVLLLAGCGTDRPNSSAHRPNSDSTRSGSSTLETSGSPPTNDGLRVLILGNSIAAGAGVPSDAAFPARLQAKIDSLGWNVTVENAGVSGETTAGGLQRIKWLLRDSLDVLVLELGGNDGLRGIDPAVTQKNLQGIIDTTLARYPQAHVLLAGMRIPPNLGSEYTRQFRKIYPSIAERFERVTLIPFVLEDVAGVDSLMQEDGIHPNARGHRRVARTVWGELKPILRRMQAEQSM